MWPRILAGGSFRRGGYARRPVGAEEPNYANFLAICPSRISFTVRAMMLVPERRIIGVAAPDYLRPPKSLCSPNSPEFEFAPPPNSPEFALQGLRSSP